MKRKTIFLFTFLKLVEKKSEKLKSFFNSTMTQQNGIASMLLLVAFCILLQSDFGYGNACIECRSQGFANETGLNGVGCRDPWNPDGTFQYENKGVDCELGFNNTFLGCRKIVQYLYAIGEGSSLNYIKV